MERNHSRKFLFPKEVYLFITFVTFSFKMILIGESLLIQENFT